MADGGRLLAGIIILTFVIITNGIVSYLTTGTSNFQNIGGCTSNDNNTSCENVGKTSFLTGALDVSVSGVDGAPKLFNDIYVTIVVLILSGAIFLIVLAFIPATSA